MNKEYINLKGSLIAIAGDNLGSHQIGGLVENFNVSGYFCRYCYIHNIKNQNDMNKIYQKRTIYLHVSDLNIDRATNDSFKGVKSDSILNNLYNFDITKSLPLCLAHDLFEGIVQEDLMISINKLVVDKVISYDLSNTKKWRQLNFCCESKIHLPLLKKKDKLPGTATQNMLLLIILPFAVEDIPNIIKSEIWSLILLLRKIT